MFHACYFENAFHQLVLLEGKFYLKTVNISQSHQIIFAKNFELLKAKFSKNLSPCFEGDLFQNQYNKARLLSPIFFDRQTKKRQYH